MDFAFYTDAERKLKELRSKEEKIEVKEGTKNNWLVCISRPKCKRGCTSGFS